MKRATLIVGLFSLILVIAGCSSSSSSNGSSGDATAYATFGKSLSDVIPAGLKTGGANASIIASSAKELSGDCATDYTDCPYLTASGGGDSLTGEILSRLWAIDYNGVCTEALISAGTCFDCTDCSMGLDTSNFVIPTMLENPTQCSTIPTTEGRYVNFGVDPCFFDTIIGQISNIADCETVQGGAVDISTAVPWYASWEIPATVDFSAYNSRTSGGIWWTLNNGAAGDQQYFLSLDSDWLYAGIKDPTADTFLFFGTGSPSYYEALGEGEGINIAAYYGPLSAVTETFEAMQVRDQAPNTYINRLRSNGTHVWFQVWSANVPTTAGAVAGVRDTPDDTRCVEIGTSVVTSMYVPKDECVTSFGYATEDELNQDDNYTLKLIDTGTAGTIDFSGALTPTTTTQCLPAE